MSFLSRRLALASTASAAASRAMFSTSARRDIAKITLVGNLAAPPEVKPTSTGKDVVEYSVASTDGYSRENRHTSWFRVSTFVEDGPRRDYLMNLTKGTTVFVEGDAVINTYSDSEGKTRTALRIYQRNMEVLRRGSGGSSDSE